MNSAKIAGWIKKKVNGSRAAGAVIGLSGGIDSAVVALLCKKALGENIVCLIMPCHSQKGEIAAAISFAKKFRLKYKIVDITKIYDAMMKILPPGKMLSAANIKPRLRMLTLYYFANNLNYLVVGTGNKSELSVGYFTKYGDGGVDILPIGNFYKSEVVELARYLGVPDEIINKAPAAGLWPGQTDEGEIGITYPELEKILRIYESGKMIADFRVKKMIVRSEHKRRPPDIFNP